VPGENFAHEQKGCTSRLQVASWPSRAGQARRAGRIWPAAPAAGVLCLLTRAPSGRKEPTDCSVLPPRWGFSGGEGRPPWARAHGQILPVLRAWRAIGSLCSSRRRHAPARGTMTPICCPTCKRDAHPSLRASGVREKQPRMGALDREPRARARGMGVRVDRAPAWGRLNASIAPGLGLSRRGRPDPRVPFGHPGLSPLAPVGGCLLASRHNADGHPLRPARRLALIGRWFSAMLAA